MLVKRTRGNQVSLPKRILEQAGIAEDARYFDVEYRGGIICLKPVTVEEQIPDRAYEELLRWARKPEPGRKVFHSGKEAVAYIKKLARKR